MSETINAVRTHMAKNLEEKTCLIFKNKKIIIIFLFIALFLLFFSKWRILISGNYLADGNKNYIVENYDAALKNYKFAEAIDGSDSIIYFARLKRAEIFYQHMMLDEAEKELIKALEENKVDYRAYNLLGDLYFAAKKFDNAAIYYNKTVNLRNENSVNLKLAKTFMAKGDLISARDIFWNMHNGSNGEESAYYLGLIDFDKNPSYNDYLEKIEMENYEKYGERIKTIKDFVSSYDKERDADYNTVSVANLYNKINEPYLALVKTDFVASNNPNYRDAWIELGKSSFIIGDYKKSMEYFNKALKLDLNNSEIYFWIGSVYERLNNKSEAEKFFSKRKLLN